MAAANEANAAAGAHSGNDQRYPKTIYFEAVLNGKEVHFFLYFIENWE